MTPLCACGASRTPLCASFPFKICMCTRRSGRVGVGVDLVLGRMLSTSQHGHPLVVHSCSAVCVYPTARVAVP